MFDDEGNFLLPHWHNAPFIDDNNNDGNIINNNRNNNSRVIFDNDGNILLQNWYNARLINVITNNNSNNNNNDNNSIKQQGTTTTTNTTISNAGSEGSRLNAVESFCLAGVAGVLSKTASAPLERVKLLIQNQDEMIQQGVLKTRYTGIFDCFKRIVRQEGLYQLWRGNVANCIRYIPTQGFNFAFKDKFTALFDRFLTADASSFTRLLSNIAAGGLAGSCCMVLVYPLDYARTRLANDAIDTAASKRRYNGLLDVWVKTWRSDGVVGIYRGAGISIAGIFVYRGFFFGLYDFFKPILEEERREESGRAAGRNLLRLFVLGYVTTVVAEVLSYPLDTIRRRMMMKSEDAVKYKGSWDCAKTVITQEGVKSMFKGCGANILRGIAGAIVLASYDGLSDAYVKLRNQIGEARGGGGGRGGGEGSGGGGESEK